MTVCRYFLSKSGCARGAQCRFQHIRQGRKEQDPISLSPVNDIIQGPELIGTTSASSFGDLLAEVTCRFHRMGMCTKGTDCRFRHDISVEGGENLEAVSFPKTEDVSGTIQDLPKAKLSNAIKSNTRELSGAVVSFGPGGSVTSVEPAVTASSTRLQMCSVNCSWYQPSKIGTLEFTSSQCMERAALNLSKTKILNRVITCRTTIEKNSKPWRCFVKAGNLDVSTNPQMLKEACGSEPRNVTFGDNSYSLSTEEVCRAVRQILSFVGTIESWNLSSSTKNNQSKATATFSTMRQATDAISEFNGYKLPELGGSKIYLSNIVKANFSILSSMYDVISLEIETVRQRFGSKEYLEIRSYMSNDRMGKYTTLQIISNNVQAAGKAKAAVQKILLGHTARGGKGLVWHEFFLNPGGVACLNDLGKRYNVFIYRNARKRILSLYGDDGNKAIVESALIKMVDDLTVSNFKIRLDTESPEFAHQAAYRKIIEKLGRGAVRLDIAARPRTISIHGSSDDADWARNILKEGRDRDDDTQNCSNEARTCSVCWCDITEPYTTPCGHAYDKDCFVHQCLSGGDDKFPVQCLGSLGSCQAVISFTDLERALSRDQFDKFLERSFMYYVRTHPKDYQYCPTAGCDQVYEVSDRAKLFTCPMCLTSICTDCGTINHEGLTCKQNQNTILVDEAFEEWKIKNGARDCPNCGSTIQKSEGCNHMQCKTCEAHICWVCMRIFGESIHTYEHMTKEHGSFYDEGEGFDDEDDDSDDEEDDEEDGEEGDEEGDE